MKKFALGMTLLVLTGAWVHLVAAQGKPPAALPEFQEGPRGRTPKTTGPTQAELLAAEANGRDWLLASHDYSGTRYSNLKQINAGNLSRLHVACSFQVSETRGGGFYPNPVVYQGTMFFTAAYSTFAIDAATCRPKWRFDWPTVIGGGQSHRGLAIKDGRVIIGTPDGYLVALDQSDGTLLWSRHVLDASNGARIRIPPQIFEDTIYIAPSESENGIRGWVGAFKLDNGEKVWRFNIVPDPGEPGSETWGNPKGFPLAGGGVWGLMSLDVQRGLLHVPAGNPAPDFAAAVRGGKNLYTNSVLALKLKTGQLAWYEQMVVNDDHDWDLTHVAPLYQITVGGEKRDVIATVGKAGIIRVLDRDTRKRIFETPVTTVENADAPVTKTGTHACPGMLGGVEWNGLTYNPAAGVLAAPSVDWCGTWSVDDEDQIKFVSGRPYFGGAHKQDTTKQGWVTAVDAASGKVRWRYRSAMPVVAAVTATGGGLVFAGELTGDVVALDVGTGAVKFRHNTGGPVAGGIVSYEVGGKQYVGVASGRTTGMWVSPSMEQMDNRFLGAPTITVFALDGGR
jgi:alcohol dehydrogenase (cytochrome c)